MRRLPRLLPCCYSNIRSCSIKVLGPAGAIAKFSCSRADGCWYCERMVLLDCGGCWMLLVGGRASGGAILNDVNHMCANFRKASRYTKASSSWG